MSRGPSAHFSPSGSPSRPRRSMRSSAPVIASKPVAKTIMSSSYSCPSAVRMPARRDLLDRCAADVDQSDVVAVERLEVVLVHGRAAWLRAGYPFGTSISAVLGVVDGLADLLADELRDRLVRLADRRAGRCSAAAGTASRRPPASDPRRPRIRSSASRLQRSAFAVPAMDTPRNELRAACGGYSGYSALDLVERLRLERPVPVRDAEVRPCAGRRRGARPRGAISGTTWIPVEPVPMTPTRLPASSTPSFGHARGVMPLALERLEPGNVRDSACADRQPVPMTQILGRSLLRRRRSSPPSARRRRRSAAAVTRVSSWMSRRRSKRSATWLRYALDLGLRRVPLRPLPLLLELRRRTSRSSRCSRRRSARPGSGSSTRCRPPRRRLRRAGRTARRSAAGAARTGRQIRRPTTAASTRCTGGA